MQQVADTLKPTQVMKLVGALLGIERRAEALREAGLATVTVDQKKGQVTISVDPSLVPIWGLAKASKATRGGE